MLWSLCPPLGVQNSRNLDQIELVVTPKWQVWVLQFLQVLDIDIEELGVFYQLRLVLLHMGCRELNRVCCRRVVGGV